jgi:ketosteroid isomerase-like protein
MKPEVHHLWIDGSVAVVEFTNHMNNIPMEACWVCRFEGGKIVEVRTYMDSARMKRILESGS